MAGAGFRAVGLPRLLATISRAIGRVTDLAGAEDKVGRVMLEESRTRAPRKSGRLAASGSAVGAVVTFGVPYSGPIHWGWRARNIEPQRFGVAGLEAAEPEIVKLYEDELQDIVQDVKGA